MIDNRTPKQRAEAWADEYRVSLGDRGIQMLIDLEAFAKERGREETRAAMQAAKESLPDDLRAIGWSVAVHNDYRQDGVPHTFWLLTKDGRCLKGEGLTDRDALDQVRSQVAAR